LVPGSQRQVHVGGRISARAAVLAQEFLTAIGDRDPQALDGRPARDIAAIDEAGSKAAQKVA